MEIIIILFLLLTLFLTKLRIMQLENVIQNLCETLEKANEVNKIHGYDNLGKNIKRYIDKKNID